MRVLLLVGTKKGVFIAESDEKRKDWRLRGPVTEPWEANHVIYDDATGTIFAACGNAWYGAAVWRSSDLGKTWEHSSEGLTLGEGEPAVGAIWSLSAAHGEMMAGIEPAGLFRSRDGGESWSHVKGLRDHPTRPNWQPGGAGLILHTIVRHPSDPEKIWVGMSSVGVFHSGDGGKTWEPQNKGVRNGAAPGDEYTEIGQCVHHFELSDADPSRMFQRSHFGMYLSDNAGGDWREISEGLPSTFGFAMAGHPRERDTVFVAPLNGDSIGRYQPEGKAVIYRSRDAGRSWDQLRHGLPQESAYFGVLRQAMCRDVLTPSGVYFGSNNGQLFASGDEGEQWNTVAAYLPPIYSVQAAVLS